MAVFVNFLNYVLKKKIVITGNLSLMLSEYFNRINHYMTVQRNPVLYNAESDIAKHVNCFI